MIFSRTFLHSCMDAPETFSWNWGEASIYLNRAPTKRKNQDALGIWQINEEAVVLAIADGAGGHAGASLASQLAIETLNEGLGCTESAATFREKILWAFENANKRICDLKKGAGSTLLVAEIHPGFLRFYHAGDSSACLLGQKGRLKHETVAHSPFPLALEAGLLAEQDREDYLEHRHIVTNMLGMNGMRVEMTVAIPLASEDTLVMASDGLWDNLTQDELAPFLPTTHLKESALQLQALCTRRMAQADEDTNYKSDDISMILFRPNL